MTEERLKEIKRIFNSYGHNVAQLGQLELPGIKGVSYDKIAVMTDKSRNTVEQLMITYLIDKEKLEKEIALVDRVYEHFADDRDEELAKLIENIDVGHSFAVLPAGHRLVGIVQLLRQHQLSHGRRLTKLAYILCNCFSQISHGNFPFVLFRRILS